MDAFQQVTNSTLKINEWMKLDPSLEVGFTTKLGGVSESPFASMNLGFHVPDNYEHVVQNRNILADNLKFPLQRWTIGKQVHGTEIAVVDEDDTGKGTLEHEKAIDHVDGIMTNKKGILCTALFADCVPMFYFDPITKWIGIAHGGWRGTVNGIATNMVEKLKAQNVDINSLLVAIGPCISKDRYQVDEKVVDHITVKYKEKVTLEQGNGHFLLDLRELNKRMLADAGVLEKNISVTNYCTYNNKELFFSHRRDQGNTGRMLGYIGFTSP